LPRRRALSAPVDAEPSTLRSKAHEIDATRGELEALLQQAHLNRLLQVRARRTTRTSGCAPSSAPRWSASGEEQLNPAAPVNCCTAECAPMRGRLLVLDECHWLADPEARRCEALARDARARAR
jgi:hypothetical protein